MCGINGIVGTNQTNAKEIIEKMNKSMRHRGPDDEGIFADERLALGHVRLSIIDLTMAGHQPMFSNNQKIVMAFNGEIYNFLSVKKQLSDYDFKTHTDTEVIIAAYQKWGLKFIEKIDGMFAIALYDIELGKLFLIRDRLGVKPIYYSQTPQGEFIFASEIRSLLASNKLERKLNADVLSDYLTWQTIPGEQTLIKNVKMIPSGSYMVVEDSNFQIHAYWDIKNYSTYTGSYQEAVKNTKNLFFKAVEKRLMADVPLGVFLSGGIDSSAVVAAMSECGTNINSYNINFNEKQFSEAKYATIVAKKFKTNHTQIDLSAQDFLSIFPSALNALDQPSWDGVNTYVVAKVVKQAGISVALSGVGGDEWFGGYPVFNLLNNASLAKLKLIPQPIRKLMSGAMALLKEDYAKAKKYELLESNLNVKDSYFAIRKLFTNRQIQTLLKQAKPFDKSYFPSSSNYSEISVAEWENYLKPMLLRDTDQMGMAHALEIREPFLDYELIEFVLSLPDAYKKGNFTKSLLVNAMGDLIPSEIYNRPKMGFVLPWEKWLKQDLKVVVNEGLDVLSNHPNFNQSTIEALRQKYFNNQYGIRWNMILNLAVLGIWIKTNDIN